MIILIASITAIIAFVVGNQIPMLKPNKEGVKIPTAEKIESTVQDPDPTVFNKDAINPTVQTVIGGSQSGQ